VSVSVFEYCARFAHFAHSARLADAVGTASRRRHSIAEEVPAKFAAL